MSALDGVKVSQVGQRPSKGSIQADGSLPPLLLGLVGGRGDVLVEAEQVGRVVASFDRGQPVPGPARVGLAEPGPAVVPQEVDIGAGVSLTQRSGEVADPGLAYGPV